MGGIGVEDGEVGPVEQGLVVTRVEPQMMDSGLRSYYILTVLGATPQAQAQEATSEFLFLFHNCSTLFPSHRLRCESHTLQMTSLKSRQDKDKDKVSHEPLDKSVHFVTSACSSWVHGKKMKRGLESQPFTAPPQLGGHTVSL